ncbi:MAG: SPOR domain-containing protein, partial [Alphaproteobacteria bacterium]
TFRNASGLPHRGQLSTARDMARLALRLLKDFPQYYHFFSTPEYSRGGLTFKNHNKMLKTYDGTDGLKTGYIHASGYNLVTSVVRDGQRLVGVVFGGRTAKARNRHMAKLLDKGFLKVSQLDVADGSIKAKSKAKAFTRASNKRQWGIQVGAYKTYEPAFKIARKAIEKAPDLLFDGKVRIVSRTKSAPGRLYRARIVGLTKRQATRACRTLKVRKINCMELRLTETPQLAAAG